MIEGEFHQMANDFIKSLIRQRKYLIQRHKSKGNPGFINGCLHTLEKFMNAYTYDTNEKMAKFWMNHCHEIFAIMPGKDCSSHKATLRNYNTLGTLARNISDEAQPQLPWSRASFN